MNELKPEDVMRALECCAIPKLTKCEKCPRKEEDALCMYRLSADALALLREKDATIARYILQIAEMQKQIATQDRVLTALMQYKKVEADKDAEIERLTAYNASLICANTDITNRHKDYVEEAQRIARNDAITEFAERLKDCISSKPSLFTQQRYIVVDVIDQIAKEMKGESDNGRSQVDQADHGHV